MLLHDIGRPSTTARRKDKITSYDHSEVSAKLAKEPLSFFTVNMEFIEQVAQLVRYHMQILLAVENLLLSDVEGMKRNTDTREIALLDLYGGLGGEGTDRRREEESVCTFLERANCTQEENRTKSNPDNRADSVEKIQHNIDTTIKNIHCANEMTEKVSDERIRENLKAKSERRVEVLGDMWHGVKDKANAAKNSRLQ